MGFAVTSSRATRVPRRWPLITDPESVHRDNQGACSITRPFKTTTLSAVIVLALVGVLAVKTCSSVTIVRPLLKEYKGKVNIPDDLYRTYERFVTALQKADRDAIAKMCLPNSVSITTERRPAGRGIRVGH